MRRVQRNDNSGQKLLDCTATGAVSPGSSSIGDMWPADAGFFGSHVISPLPRLLVRAAIRRAIAVVQGCWRTADVQTGTRRPLQRPTQPLPASSYGHQFPRSCKTYSPPGRSGERAGITVTRVTGYLRVHSELVDAHLFARWGTLRIRHFNGLDCSIESRRPRSSEPQPSYSAAIFMRFRGRKPPRTFHAEPIDNVS